MTDRPPKKNPNLQQKEDQTALSTTQTTQPTPFPNLPHQKTIVSPSPAPQSHKKQSTNKKSIDNFKISELSDITDDVSESATFNLSLNVSLKQIRIRAGSSPDKIASRVVHDLGVS